MVQRMPDIVDDRGAVVKPWTLLRIEYWFHLVSDTLAT